MSKTYTCEECGGVFEFGRSDEDARAEQHQNFGDMPDSEMALVCDDCYKTIMADQAALSVETPDREGGKP